MRIADAISAETSVMLLGTISVVFVLRDLAVGIDGVLGHLQLHGLLAARLADRRGDAFDGVGGRFGHRDDRRRLALGLVDLGLLLAFGAGDEGLALAGGDVDLLLPAALRGGDQRALLALGRDLRLHRVQDLLGRRQVLDLVAQHLHAPVERGLVDGRRPPGR